MSQVFFAPLEDNPSLSEQVATIRKLIERAGMARIIASHDFVAIKVHVGEVQRHPRQTGAGQGSGRSGARND